MAAREMDRPDLVEENYREYVRPLGNLVILCAQTEMAYVAVLALLLDCGEDKASRKKIKCEQVLPLASKIASEDIRRAFENATRAFFEDREARNRLFHDEWWLNWDEGFRVSLRGFPRSGGPDPLHHETTPDEIWLLAERFAEHEAAFRDAEMELRRMIHQELDLS